MNNLNSILIEGNMVRDPLFRSTPKGTPVCTFSLASNRYFKQDSGLEKEVSFFEVESWVKNNFLQQILEELEDFQNFIEKCQSGPETEKFIEKLEALLDIIEDCLDD
jgi:hypothetical protein